MTVKQSSYRQIMKATSIFGGVQVFKIVISIIRSKVIAVLLGPAGMGIAGLLTSTIDLIGNITNFGLGSSAVRDVSVAVSTQDNEKIRTTVSIIRRLVWITGLLGTLVTIMLAPYLSELTFGNREYTLAFISISITLLLTQLSAGQLVVLQGLRKLKHLAKADVAGAFLGLVFSVPLYYKFGTRGIVPAIIISAFLTLFFSWFFSSKIHIARISINKHIFRSEGLSMLKLGFMLSVSGLISILASYILKIFIGRTGGVEQVGFYNAGFAIINTYVGMIFTAMKTDYFPRLTEVSADNEKARNVINEQAEIAILIIAPILAGFLIFIKWAVILLYSHEFVVVNDMLHWAALGLFFKTVSWAIGFVFLAKGASGMFFWNELIANIYLLLLNIFCYRFFGLDGLGISFFAGYILFFLQVFIVTKIYYDFDFEKAFYRLFVIQFILGLLCFLTMQNIAYPFSYMLGLVLFIMSATYSYMELNKRLNMNQILFNLFDKIKARYR